ncbi:uncharacterized protein LOC128882981 isoform X2 [Hylaeus volcanicus]|uniref:uncharacterized protein LOC128882981 isoform X2 n=1 Tax=Hylaeus volcanicus TaxID=313075 RepID=UPI0023B8729D|nr:uncharacterized protein LOC128882981 isoform X2 [Hylaeus volcanicus]
MCELLRLNLVTKKQSDIFKKTCVGSVSTSATVSDVSVFHDPIKHPSTFNTFSWSFYRDKLSHIKPYLCRPRFWPASHKRQSRLFSKKSVLSIKSTTSKNFTEDQFNVDALFEHQKQNSHKVPSQKSDYSPTKCFMASCFSSYGSGSVRHSRRRASSISQSTLLAPLEPDLPSHKTHVAAHQLGIKEVAIHSSRRRLSLSQSDPVGFVEEEHERGTCLVSEALKEVNEKKRLNNKSATKRNNNQRNAVRTLNGQRLSVTGLPASMPQQEFEKKIYKIFASCQEVDDVWLSSIGIGYTCRKGLKPESPNQDDFFIFVMEDWALYGVFDGHGPFGHDISNFVQKRLPRLIYENTYFEKNAKQALWFSFIMVQKLLEIESGCRNTFSCVLSGSHVGDSRCVLGRHSQNGTYAFFSFILRLKEQNGYLGITAVDLTIDHKPNNEAERRRILERGGELRKLEGDLSYRIFLKKKQFPGLAISRAIGDTAGAQAGVSCEPDIREYTLNSRDTFIILCSDGVWEFLSSKFVVELVYCNGPDAVQLSADMIAREAWERWIEEGNVVDDITVEIIYL